MIRASVAAGCTLAAGAGGAQLEPFGFQCAGIANAVDSAVWGGSPGDLYVLEFNGMLNTSGPVVIDGDSATWNISNATASIALRGQPPRTHSGSISIRITEGGPDNPDSVFIGWLFGTGDAVFLFLDTETGSDLIQFDEPPRANQFDQLLIDPGSNALSVQNIGQPPSLLGSVTSLNATGFGGEPEITSQPTPDAQVVDAGQFASLGVEAIGDDLEYQWRRDGVPLADGPFITGSDADGLRIFTTSADTGVYDCVISNDQGTAITDPAMLGVRNVCPADQNFDNQASPSDFNAWILNFNAGC